MVFYSLLVFGKGIPVMGIRVGRGPRGALRAAFGGRVAESSGVDRGSRGQQRVRKSRSEGSGGRFQRARESIGVKRPTRV